MTAIGEERATQTEAVGRLFIVVVDHVGRRAERATPHVHIVADVVGCQVAISGVHRAIFIAAWLGPAQGKDGFRIVVVLHAEQLLIVVHQRVLSTVDDLITEADYLAEDGLVTRAAVVPSALRQQYLGQQGLSGIA